MNCTQIQELAAAFALGTLDRAEAARMQAMANADPDIRAELDSFLAVAERLVQGISRVAPPAGARAKILAQISRTPQLQPVSPATHAFEPLPAGFRFLRPAEGEWTDGPVPGARFQTLSADWRRNHLMLYIELDPGVRYPDHTHTGPEQLFVISGDLLTAGRLLRAGDFVHCDPGTHHDEVMSPSGCQALLVTPMSSAVGELARAKLRLAGDKLAGSLGLSTKA